MGEPKQRKRHAMSRSKRSGLVLRLYITPGADSSQRAVTNVRFICTTYLVDDYDLEIIDTLQDPLRALQDGIIITPTLIKLAPEPTWTIVGDLSEDARVLASMHAGANPPG